MENMREISSVQDSGGMEELSAYIEVMKIKKAVFGGFDKIDVYQKMQSIGERYQQILNHQLEQQRESIDTETAGLKEELKTLYEQKLEEEKLLESKNKEIEMLTDQLNTLDSGDDQSAKASEKIRDLQSQLRRAQNQLRRHREEREHADQNEPKENPAEENRLEEAMAILREARLEAEQIKREAAEEAEKETLRVQALVRRRMESMEKNIQILENRNEELDVQLQDKIQRLQKISRGFDELKAILFAEDDVSSQRLASKNSDFSVLGKLRVE